MQAVAKTLHRRGYPVEIVFGMYDEGTVLGHRDSFSVKNIRPYKPTNFLAKLTRPRNIVRHIKTEIRSLDSPAIHWIREPHYARAVAERFPDDPCIYIAATVYPNFMKYSRYSGLLNFLRNLVFQPQISQVERRAVELCTLVVSSQARRNEFVKYYNVKPRQIHVIHPGIDQEYYGSEGALEERNPNRRPVGLTVCRFSPEKSVDRLLYMLRELKTLDWEWLIIGDGFLRSKLERLSHKLGMGNRVRFLGSVDAREYYRMADLFVLPSQYEGFGLVLLEAMANALPCVAYQSNPPKIITASSEIIDHGSTGFIVNADIPDDMINCLVSLIKNADLRNQMGRNGYQRCVENFNWDKTVDQLLALTEDIKRS